LNIFGNHFSSSSGNKFYKNENKFGFDKVILVGDTKNIKGIFTTNMALKLTLKVILLNIQRKHHILSI